MKLAVILFAYKRPNILLKALATHKKIDADYYCFVDWSPMQKLIYEIVESKQLYAVFLKDKSAFKGIGHQLNSNITTGITKVFNMGYDAVIVLEDDLLIADDGFEYLSDQLNKLKDDDRYGSVCLSKGDILNKDFRCWGWGTWRNVWDKIDFRLPVSGTHKKGWDKTHSWDYYVAFWMELNQLYARASEFSRVKHIGNLGVHHKWYSAFSVRKLFRVAL